MNKPIVFIPVTIALTLLALVAIKRVPFVPAKAKALFA